MLAIFPLFLTLGLFLPGFFIAKYLRHPLWWASAFTISLLVLFHSIFWLGVLGLHIKLWPVLPILLAVSAAAGWLQQKFAVPVATAPVPPLIAQDRILLLLSGV